jgi:hypothetical protein
MRNMKDIFKKANDKRSEIEQLITDLEAHLSEKKDDGFSTYRKYVEGVPLFAKRSHDLGLTSPEGLRRSGLKRIRTTVQGQQLADHILKEAKRIIRILDNPEDYTPRENKLYTSSSRSLKRRVPLHEFPPMDYDPLIP